MSKARLAGTSPSALASWAITGRSPAAADELGRVVERRRRARGRRPRRRRSASASRPGSARPRGSRAGRRSARARRRRSFATSAGVPSLDRRSSIAPRRPRAAGSPPSRARASASSSRRSGSRSSHSRNTGRTPERSTSRVSSASRSMSIGTSRTIVASRLESRAASACSVRFCLRLAPEISSTLLEHGLEVAEALQQVGGGLVADARDAGDVVARVALEADEVGDQLRRDAVAVDHALAVVDLRVGDAAARCS